MTNPRGSKLIFDGLNMLIEVEVGAKALWDGGI